VLNRIPLAWNFNDPSSIGYHYKFSTTNFYVDPDVSDGRDDIIEGGDGEDYIIGGSGDDYLYGKADGDIIYENTGADYIDGDAGNDTYIFSQGAGQDSIHDTDGADMIRFTDVNPEEVTVTRTAHDLKISVNGTANSLSVAGWFDWAGSKVEQVAFGDGTTWNAADLETRITAAPSTSEDDDLYGGPGNETIMGVAGDNYLYGNLGKNSVRMTA
jgi:Ca2+-binding RTX toxin-like protein